MKKKRGPSKAKSNPPPAFDEPLTPQKSVLRSARLAEDVIELADTCAEVLTSGNRTALIEQASLEYALSLIGGAEADDGPRQLPSDGKEASAETFRAAVELYVEMAERFLLRIDHTSRYHASPLLVDAVQQELGVVVADLATVAEEGNRT